MRKIEGEEEQEKGYKDSTKTKVVDKIAIKLGRDGSKLEEGKDGKNRQTGEENKKD